MNVFGIPAHPLLVHVPVVGIPLLAVGLILTCWRAAWVRWFLGPLVVFALVVGVFAFFAAESGGDLENELRSSADASERHAIHEHAEQGELARNAAIALAISMVAFGAVAILADRRRIPSWTLLAAYGVNVVVGVGAVVIVVMAGHSGAEAAWDARLAANVSSVP